MDLILHLPLTNNYLLSRTQKCQGESLFDYQTRYNIFLFLEFGLHYKSVKRNNKFPLSNDHVCVCLVKPSPDTSLYNLVHNKSQQTISKNCIFNVKTKTFSLSKKTELQNQVENPSQRTTLKPLYLQVALATCRLDLGKNINFVIFEPKPLATNQTPH